MNRTEKLDTAIRHYLLGELAEPEQAALESEYFGDREKFEEVCAIENDLIDDYIRGNLSAGDREQFERRYFSSPERLRRVQFAGSMLRSLYGTVTTTAARAPGPVPAGFRRALSVMSGRWRLATVPLLATFGLILAVAVGMLALENLRLRRALTTSEQSISQQAQKEQELGRQLGEQRASAEQLARDLEALRTRETPEQTPSGPASIVASFILRPGLIRGSAEPQRLLIPPGVDVIALRLHLKTVDFKKYTGNLMTPEGTALWNQAALKVRPSQTGATVLMRVPAKRVPPGDYILRVDGMNPAGESSEVADCYFRVTKKTGT